MISWYKVSLWLIGSILNLNLAQAKVEATIGAVPLNQNTNIAIALPDSSLSEILISRDQYLISYNKNRRAPNWVAWRLDADQIGSSGRTNKFTQDSDLADYFAQKDPSQKAVQSTDYTNSCFDRGHQIPSGDRTDTAANNATTFVMSNMIPQTPYLNRVVWEHLESYTRTLVTDQSKTVFVIDGPIYDQDFGSIGPNKDIPVPSKDFKIIFVLDKGSDTIDQNTQMITVIMPNTLKDGSIPKPFTANCGGDSSDTVGASDDWKQYQTTLADIESKSGLSFSDLVKTLKQ